MTWINAFKSLFRGLIFAGLIFFSYDPLLKVFTKVFTLIEVSIFIALVRVL